MTIIYTLLPFDLLPEAIFGFVGCVQSYMRERGKRVARETCQQKESYRRRERVCGEQRVWRKGEEAAAAPKLGKTKAKTAREPAASG